MKRPLLTGCAVVILGVVLWNGLSEEQELLFSNRQGTEAFMKFKQGETIRLRGKVCEIEQSYVTLHEIETLPGKYKITCDISGENLKIGNHIEFEGCFQQFDSATNPGGFDEKKYYMSQNIIGEIKGTSVIYSDDSCNWFIEGLRQLRKYYIERLYRVYPSKEAGVLGKMLLGDSSGLAPRLKELYTNNGLIHILSISGLHITLIGMGLFRLLRKSGCPVWLAAVLGGILIVLYGLMTGMAVSAVRAIGMYLIRMLALLVGRTYDMMTAVGVIATAMLLINPNYLNSSGFLLSFGSVLGVGVLFPSLKQIFLSDISTGKGIVKICENINFYDKGFIKINETVNFLNKGFEKIAEIILASISITLMTMPLQLWFFYEIPVWSVFLNLFVLPFMSLLVLCGMVSVCIPQTGLIGTLPCIILTYYEWLCGLFSKLPFHMWNPGQPKLWQIIIYYLGLFGGMTILIKFGMGKKNGLFPETGMGKKEDLFPETGTGNKEGLLTETGTGKRRGVFPVIGARKKRYFVPVLKYILLIGFMILLPAVFTLHEPEKNKVTFLDVGQGDCIILQLKTGENYMFDCGSLTKKNVCERVLLPYLKCNGIKKLDGIFVSHEDWDHAGGILSLLQVAEKENISIEQLVFSGKEVMDAFLGTGDAQINVPIRYINGGDAWEIKNVRIVCVNPPRDDTLYTWDSNEKSLAFLVSFTEGEIPIYLVLTADVENKGEQYMIDQIAQEIAKDGGKECKTEPERKNNNQLLQDKQLASGMSDYDWTGNKSAPFVILKAAHHGSRYATSEELLSQLCPDITVISSGRNNSFGHPHTETLQRLENMGTVIFRTDTSGAVIIEMGVKGNEVRVKEYVHESESLH